MDTINYNSIGIIHSPFKEPYEVPIQSIVAKDIQGTIDIFPEYVGGLADVEGFSHIILLYHFHLSKGYSLKVKPYLDNELRGVFATRAPARPNPIGMSIVRLVRIEKEKLFIKDVDIIDGTPLLDIKPYVPAFDIREKEKIGWLENRVHKLSKTKK
jgi:tRNA-Thr(GGU) m(6)t(6)A37 methyltransferase TsaA